MNIAEARRRARQQRKSFPGLLPGNLVVLSYGAGQDSTALLLMALYDKAFRNKYIGDRRFIVITSDTGNEHPETYKYIEYISKKVDAEFYFLTKGLGFHSESWPDLKSFYRRTGTVGSKAFPKTCTDNLKIKVIYRFLEYWIEGNYRITGDRKAGIKAFAEKYGKITVILGIAADETKRATGNNVGPEWMKYSINKVYPLIDLGMNRADCQDYIRSKGFKVPFPSNCMICPFMSDIELVWLYKFYPSEYKQWVEIERAKLIKNSDKGKKNLTVWGSQETLPDILKKSLIKHKDWSDEKLYHYKMSHGHCNMSLY
jgi:3'-phosphoadenosine 5'-phosphosulfate sulfotransferase (PAPS reductase)/FAD synthetase